MQNRECIMSYAIIGTTKIKMMSDKHPRSGQGMLLCSWPWRNGIAAEGCHTCGDKDSGGLEMNPAQEMMLAAKGAHSF